MEYSEFTSSGNEQEKQNSREENDKILQKSSVNNEEIQQQEIIDKETTMLTAENSEQDNFSQKYPCAPAPPVEIKLFVGRIPRSMSEDDIRPLFENFGDVLEVAIIRERSTSAHKGSAFIRMACIAEADAAIREMNGQKVLDPGLGPILVKYAAGEAERLGLTSDAGEGLNQAKLFVGSIPKTMSDEEVKKLFEPFGVVDEVFVMRDSSGVGKGCAFVKFAYKEQALYAIKQLDKKKTLEGLIRPMEVRCAESRGKRSDGGGAINRNKMVQYSAMGTNTLNGGYFTNAQGGTGTVLPNNNAPCMVGPWKEYFNNEGSPYYHNVLTNVTQWDRPIEFDQINRLGQANRASEVVTGAPGSNLFVFHIPNEWTDNHLAGAFSQFGPIVSATIAKDKSGLRNRGFGFVSYNNPYSAMAAVSKMNGFLVLGKRLKVSFKQEKESTVQMSPGGSAVGISPFNGSTADFGG